MPNFFFIFHWAIACSKWLGRNYPIIKNICPILICPVIPAQQFFTVYAYSKKLGKFYPIVGLVIPNAYLPSAGCPLCRHLSFDTCWVNAYSKKLGKSWPTYTQFSFTQWSLPNISKSVCTVHFVLLYGNEIILNWIELNWTNYCSIPIKTHILRNVCQN